MDTLSQVAVDTSGITVSGLSAGAYMAHQLLVAYSDVFSGLGAIAGGPFLCSKGSMHSALTSGMRGDPQIDVMSLVNNSRSLENAGFIAPLDNLEDARVWIFRGTEDSTVLRPPVDALEEYALNFTGRESIAYVDDVACRHTMPTDTFDRQTLSPHVDPFIDNVGYDAAGQLLSHLYGRLQPRTSPKGSLMRFDQSEFLHMPQLFGMGSKGFVYYPTGALQGRRCRLHVALHGCEQYEARLGRMFAEHAGYNEWAEANDIVVLYPQTFPTVSPFVFNPKGSWDWFSLVDWNFCTRLGHQQRAIFNMVDRVTGHELSSRGISPEKPLFCRQAPVISRYAMAA